MKARDGDENMMGSKQDEGVDGTRHSDECLTSLLDAMSDDAVRFSYRVLLQAEAHRQLGRVMDGNLMTCMVAVQQDINIVRSAILSAR